MALKKSGRKQEHWCQSKNEPQLCLIFSSISANPSPATSYLVPMTNLTITIDEESLKKARIRALEEGTSVNALLRYFLKSYAGVRREQKMAVQKILTIAKRSQSRRGERTCKRDELYERQSAGAVAISSP